MIRNEEYRALLEEIDSVPEALQSTVCRASKRIKALRKRREGIAIFGAGLAVCLTSFILLVNLSVPFARACGSIPLVRELAKAVAWSPSLSAAVENEYVQPIGQSRTENGITATVEYVIVDRRQLNIFYTVDFSGYEELSCLYDYDPGELRSWSGSGGIGQLTSGDLEQIGLDFVDSDVPAALDITLKFYEPQSLEPAPQAGDVHSHGQRERDYTAELAFHLEFDPYFTAQGEIIPVNTGFTLDGQRFTVTEIELYPTHLRIDLADDTHNTAQLSGLDLYLENEHGQRFESRSGSGIKAVGPSAGGGNMSFWMDSPFFSQGERLTLCITQAQWRDRDVPRVRLDLTHCTAEHLPDGVCFWRAERRNDGWDLEFLVSAATGASRNHLTVGGFWDEEGNHTDIRGCSCVTGYDDPETGERVGEKDFFMEMFTLEGLDGDIAYLEPSFNRVTAFEEPVSIPLR